jgi:hypothetical protein
MVLKPTVNSRIFIKGGIIKECFKSITAKNPAKLEVGWKSKFSLKEATKGIEKGGFQLVNFNVFRF